MQQSYGIQQHTHKSHTQIKDLGAKAGVVLNPGTPLTAIEYVLPIVDLVLIMSVNPGFGGQKFIESQVDKIRKLRAMCDEQVRGVVIGLYKSVMFVQPTRQGLNPWIEVDGGVTPANAYKVIDAGANALVAGSAVFGAPDYAEGALCTIVWNSCQHIIHSDPRHQGQQGTRGSASVE